jgi:hypothetical protein
MLYHLVQGRLVAEHLAAPTTLQVLEDVPGLGVLAGNSRWGLFVRSPTGEWTPHSVNLSLSALNALVPYGEGFMFGGLELVWQWYPQHGTCREQAVSRFHVSKLIPIGPRALVSASLANEAPFASEVQLITIR